MLVEVFGFGSRFASEVASINESSELLLTNDSVIICDMEKMTVNTSDVSDDRSLNHILDMHLSDLVSSGPRKMTLCRSGLCLVTFSCTDSSLWTVGLNTLNPTVTRSALQIPTLQLISPSIQVSQISVGHTHVLAADSLGRLYSFGRGECGQLGIGMKCPWTDHPIHVPVVNNALEEFVVGVSAGSLHSAVVTATGRVFTFGCGANCRLGLSRAVGSAVYPVETAGEGTMGWGASTVSSDDYGNAGSTKYGESYVSSCGPRDDDNVFIPQLVQDLEGVGSLLPNGTSTGVLMVSCGVWHTVAVAKDTYDVYVWGWSKYGQCGRPQEEIVRCPRRVSELDSILQVPQQKIVDDPCNYNCSDDTYDNESIAGIYCGAQYTAIHTKSGRVIIMGILSTGNDLFESRTGVSWYNMVKPNEEKRRRGSPDRFGLTTERGRIVFELPCPSLRAEANDLLASKQIGNCCTPIKEANVDHGVGVSYPAMTAKRLVTSGFWGLAILWGDVGENGSS